MKKQSQFLWVEDDSAQQQDVDWQPYPPVKKIKKVNTNRTEFVGWGSKQLINFLASIGVDTDIKLSQEQVTDKVNKYIIASNLINPSKKKRVMCDEKLHLLFGRKTVGRNKIPQLLERHLAENQENFTSDADDYSLDEDISVTPKRKAASSAEKNIPKKSKLEETCRFSCFAEVIPENIKLVYLKKSLVQQLSRDLESNENKLAGSFVRIKSDPHDFTQKNYFQLVRVTGISKQTETQDPDKKLILKVCNSSTNISINMLSEDDFFKEECEDLQRRIKDGLLERLTVAEMEQKAQSLHQDITKHWIETELVKLQNRIDFANEKGWRRELADYIDRKMLLQTPSEQTRLLQESPKVIAEKIVPEPVKEATPKSVSEHKEKVIPEPAQKAYSGDVSDDEDDWLDSVIKLAEESRAQASIETGLTTTADPAPAFVPEIPAVEGQVENNTNEGDADAVTPAKVSKNMAQSSSELAVESSKTEASVSILNDNLVIPQTDNTADNLKISSLLPKVDGQLSSPFANLTVSVKDLACSAELVSESPKIEAPGKLYIPAVIELSDDDEEEQVTSQYQPESPIWQYMDPQGAVQGPFPLISMKRWADACYFPPGFMIWKKGMPNIKYSLAEVLRQSFPIDRRPNKS